MLHVFNVQILQSTGADVPGNRWFVTVGTTRAGFPASLRAFNLNPAVRRPPRPVRHLPPMISNCGADHLVGDKRFFCNRLQPTVRWPLRGRQLPDLGLILP
jgi:hypothetical protein